MQGNIDKLLEIMTRLRDPENGCPWDVEQNFTSIAPYTIEEAYEVDEAIRENDMEALCDELGDLLLQVVFHAEMAREAGHFDFNDVVDSISEKMVRRHPHVFADLKIKDADQQNKAWEIQKASERAAQAGKNKTAPSALDGVAMALPALMRAEKIQKRAARVGFDWRETGPVIEKIAEELAEIDDARSGSDGGNNNLSMECGDLLFSCVNLIRHLAVDAETALRDSNAKFENRFRHLESIARTEDKQISEMDLEQLDQIWRRVKAVE